MSASAETGELTDTEAELLFKDACGALAIAYNIVPNKNDRYLVDKDKVNMPEPDSGINYISDHDRIETDEEIMIETDGKTNDYYGYSIDKRFDTVDKITSYMHNSFASSLTETLIKDFPYEKTTAYF